MTLFLTLPNNQVKQINLPYYCEYEGFYYKVISKDEVLTICPDEDYTLMRKTALELVRSDVSKASEITPGKFKAAMVTADYLINKTGLRIDEQTGETRDVA